jgi:hypothetical protein
VAFLRFVSLRSGRYLVVCDLDGFRQNSSLAQFHILDSTVSQESMVLTIQSVALL